MRVKFGKCWVLTFLFFQQLIPHAFGVDLLEGQPSLPQAKVVSRDHPCFLELGEDFTSLGMVLETRLENSRSALFWSGIASILMNSTDAEQFCSRLGARLPNTLEYAYFLRTTDRDSYQGLLARSEPYLGLNAFSRTARLEAALRAQQFSGIQVLLDQPRSFGLVRCVKEMTDPDTICRQDPDCNPASLF